MSRRSRSATGRCIREVWIGRLTLPLWKDRVNHQDRDCRIEAPVCIEDRVERVYRSVIMRSVLSPVWPFRVVSLAGVSARYRTGRTCPQTEYAE